MFAAPQQIRHSVKTSAGAGEYPQKFEPWAIFSVAANRLSLPS